MASQKDLKKRLKQLMKKPENLVCSDCVDPKPTWASIIVPPPGAPEGAPQIGAFCCYQCSGSHRQLGVHISFVRSITLDDWKEKEVIAMEIGGNKRVNGIFEAGPFSVAMKPQKGADNDVRGKFIFDKYQHRKFYDPSGYSAIPDPSTVTFPASKSKKKERNTQQNHDDAECAFSAEFDDLAAKAGRPAFDDPFADTNAFDALDINPASFENADPFADVEPISTDDPFVSSNKSSRNDPSSDKHGFGDPFFTSDSDPFGMTNDNNQNRKAAIIDSRMHHSLDLGSFRFETDHFKDIDAAEPVFNAMEPIHETSGKMTKGVVRNQKRNGNQRSSDSISNSINSFGSAKTGQSSRTIQSNKTSLSARTSQSASQCGSVTGSLRSNRSAGTQNAHTSCRSLSDRLNFVSPNIDLKYEPSISSKSNGKATAARRTDSAPNPAARRMDSSPNPTARRTDSAPNSGSAALPRTPPERRGVAPSRSLPMRERPRKKGLNQQNSSDDRDECVSPSTQKKTPLRRKKLVVTETGRETIRRPPGKTKSADSLGDMQRFTNGESRARRRTKGLATRQMSKSPERKTPKRSGSESADLIITKRSERSLISDSGDESHDNDDDENRSNRDQFAPHRRGSTGGCPAKDQQQPLGNDLYQSKYTQALKLDNIKDKLPDCKKPKPIERRASADLVSTSKGRKSVKASNEKLSPSIRKKSIIRKVEPKISRNDVEDSEHDGLTLQNNDKNHSRSKSAEGVLLKNRSTTEWSQIFANMTKT